MSTWISVKELCLPPLWIKISFPLQTFHTALKKKEPCGSALMAPCSIHLLYAFQLFYGFFLSILCFFPSADSLSGRVLVLFLPTFLLCVSAAADPFLKIRATKAALILTWQSFKPLCLEVPSLF